MVNIVKGKSIAIKKLVVDYFLIEKLGVDKEDKGLLQDVVDFIIPLHEISCGVVSDYYLHYSFIYVTFRPMDYLITSLK